MRGVRGRVHTVVGSPVGPVHLGVEVDDDGSALALVRLTRSDERAADTHADVTSTFVDPADEPLLAEAVAQLDAYFAGRLRTFDLPLRLVGSAFQVRVWQGLCEVPYGTTSTYGELAARVGLDPRTSSRAVGAANGANRLAIVVPCHRVIGADGTLTGYAAGVDRKRALLELEGALAPGAATLF